MYYLIRQISVFFKRVLYKNIKISLEIIKNKLETNNKLNVNIYLFKTL